MQFGIRDLLLLTTVVAIYAAGTAQLMRIDNNEASANIDWIIVIAYFLPCAAMTLVMGWRSRRRLGNLRVGWQNRYWWMPQIVFLVMFGGYVAGCTWWGRTLGLYLPFFFAIQQFFMLAQTRIALGENGVLMGTVFIPWQDCHIHLNTDKKQLEGWARGQLWPLRFPMTSMRTPTPDEHREAIDRILTEKRPEMRPTR